jgi:polysaccharide export outer membrane protein
VSGCGEAGRKQWTKRKKQANLFDFLPVVCWGSETWRDFAQTNICTENTTCYQTLFFEPRSVLLSTIFTIFVRTAIPVWDVLFTLTNMMIFLNPFTTIFSKPVYFHLLVAAFISAGLFSCKTTAPSTYLKTIKKDTTITGLVGNDFESKIQVGDQLSITVTSLSAEEDGQFNKAGSLSTSPSMTGFRVYPDGTVLLHRLGRVQVEGMTRRELAAKLEKDLLPFMKEPIVNVNYLNHKVTILGAVGKSQVLNMPEEQLNIFEVLLSSGDISKDGLKNKVVVIREEENRKVVKHLDLEDHSIFNSPWYYVRANDIILVNTDYEKIEKEDKRVRFQSTMAFVTGTASFLLFILDRIFR